MFSTIAEIIFRLLPLIDTGIQIWNGIEINNITLPVNGTWTIRNGLSYPEPLCCRPPPLFEQR